MSLDHPHLLELHSLWSVVHNLRATSGRLKKQNLLHKAFCANPNLARYFRIVHDDFRQHYLSSHVAICGAVVDGKAEHFTGKTVFDVLDRLAKRQVTGHAAELEWTGFLIQAATVQNKSGVVEIANCLLDKNFKCHVGTKLVNTVLNSLGMEPIRTFRVALGEPWKGERVWVTYPPAVYASRKLDGLRCLAIVGETKDVEGFPSVRLVTRKGKPFATLNRLRKRLRVALKDLPPMVLDGEVALRTEDGSDDFRGIMRQWKRKDHTIKNPMYHVFDCLTLKEFQAASGEVPFKARQAMLKMTVMPLLPEKYFQRVRQIRIRKDTDFAEMQAKVKRRKWEGLILRKDTAYLGSRSTDILKVKKMKELEAKVVGIKTGPFETNKGGTKVIETMTAVFIQYRGVVFPGRHKCKVGSGWTLAQRQAYHENPELIIGSEITVQYFEESLDKNEKPSLRFPVVKAVHGKKREV